MRRIVSLTTRVQRFKPKFKEQEHTGNKTTKSILTSRPIAELPRKHGLLIRQGKVNIQLKDLSEDAPSIFQEDRALVIALYNKAISLCNGTKDPNRWLFTEKQKLLLDQNAKAKRKKKDEWQGLKEAEPDKSDKTELQDILDSTELKQPRLRSNVAPAKLASEAGIGSKNIITILKEKARTFRETGVNPDALESLRAAMESKSYSIEKNRRINELRNCQWTFMSLLEEDRTSIENINLLIRSFAEKREFSASLEVYEKMISHGFLPDENTYVYLLIAANKDKTIEISQSREIFLELRRHAITPTTKIYCQLIMNHVVAGHITDGFALLRKMEDERIPISVHVFTVLINGLVNLEKNGLAWEVFWSARSWKNIKPDEVLFTVMIKSCVKTSECEKALGILDDLRSSSDDLGNRLYPTDVTYAHLIDCLSRRSDFASRAIEFWDQMQAEDMPMTVHVATGLFQACASLGNLSLLGKIIMQVSENSIPFLPQFYCLMVRTVATSMTLENVSDFERVGNLHVAWEIVKDAQSKNIKVSSQFLNEIMQVYRLGGFSRYAVEMLSQFSKFACLMTSDTFIVLLKLFGIDLMDERRFFIVFDYLAKSTDEKMVGFVMNEEILRLALNVAMKITSSARTLEILDRMTDCGVFPLPDQASTLAKVGKNVIDIHHSINSLIHKQREVTHKKICRSAGLNQLDIQEHDVILAEKGTTSKHPTPEQEGREKFYKFLNKKTGGYKKPFLPLHKHRQLTRRGGKLYARKHDKPRHNVLFRD